MKQDYKKTKAKLIKLLGKDVYYGLNKKGENKHVRK